MECLQLGVTGRLPSPMVLIKRGHSVIEKNEKSIQVFSYIRFNRETFTEKKIPIRSNLTFFILYYTRSTDLSLFLQILATILRKKHVREGSVKHCKWLKINTVGSRNSHNSFFVFDLNKEFPGDSLY